MLGRVAGHDKVLVDKVDLSTVFLGFLLSYLQDTDKVRYNSLVVLQGIRASLAHFIDEHDTSDQHPMILLGQE